MTRRACKPWMKDEAGIPQLYNLYRCLPPKRARVLNGRSLILNLSLIRRGSSSGKMARKQGKERKNGEIEKSGLGGGGGRREWGKGCFLPFPFAAFRERFEFSLTGLFSLHFDYQRSPCCAEEHKNRTTKLYKRICLFWVWQDELNDLVKFGFIFHISKPVTVRKIVIINNFDGNASSQEIWNAPTAYGSLTAKKTSAFYLQSFSIKFECFCPLMACKRRSHLKYSHDFLRTDKTRNRS